MPAPRSLNAVVTAASTPRPTAEVKPRPLQMAPDARGRLAALVASEVYYDEAGHDRRTYLPPVVRATIDTYAVLTAAGKVTAASQVLDTIRSSAARDRRARGQAALDALATRVHGAGWPQMEAFRRQFDASVDAQHGPGEALRRRRIAALRARVARTNPGSAA